jgi:hypothetical protein
VRLKGADQARQGEGPSRMRASGRSDQQRFTLKVKRCWSRPNK